MAQTKSSVAIVLVSVLICLALPAASTAQNEMEDVQIETVKVADGIYMLIGRGGNIGVSVGDDCAFLIDDQFAPLTEKILAAVAKISDQPIRFVLNTHFHGDHTGGNENLGQSGVLIVAHDNVRERMSVEQFNFFSNSTRPASPTGALPVVTFNDTVTFHFNGEEIHAYHVPPAHTDGDSIVHFRKSNVVHLGDLYFNGIFPFIDVASGGSIDGVIAAAARALEQIDDKAMIIPGHGPLSNRAELAAYHEMLIGVRKQVKAQVDAGKSLEETLAAKPAAAFEEEWGDGFLNTETFLGIVYQSLTKSP